MFCTRTRRYDESKKKSSYLLIFVVLTLVIAGFTLTSCAAPSSSKTSDVFQPEQANIDSTGLYSYKDTIETAAHVEGSLEQGTGSEAAVSIVSASITTELPSEISRADFGGGGFDELSMQAMQESFGYAPDQNGNLPENISYVRVVLAIKNNAGAKIIYDTSRPSFFISKDDGSLVPVGGIDPLWRSDWNGTNAKHYWEMPLETDEEKQVSLLFALSNDEIKSTNLLFVIDPGNAANGNGHTGMKAFEISDLFAQIGA